MKITRRQLRQIIKEAGSYTSRMPKTGPMSQLARFFEELGDGMWKFKLTPQGATFQLPTFDNQDHGYFVLVTFEYGVYKMKWIKREKTNEYPYVRVIRPRNGWEVYSVPRDLRNAVDEIIYDITKHEAEPESWSPGAGNV